MKATIKKIIFYLAVSGSPFAYADGNPALTSELETAVQEAQAKALARAQAESDQQDDSTDAPPAAELPKTDDSREMILGLLDEVDRLKTKVVVTKRTTLATQSPKQAMAIGSNTVYPFIEGKLYELNAGVEKVTDIALQPGEKLSNPPMAGDTVRWKIGILNSGGGTNEVTHIVIKPLDTDLETNLIITTDKRVYHLRLVSGDWYMPSMSWVYPEEEKLEAIVAAQRAEREELISIPPEKLRFDYEIDGKDYDWKPEVVFDDGAKTYLRMPESIRASEAPALFILDDDSEPMLVNFRVKGRFYIIDRLFERAELRVGVHNRVTVLSPRYDRSFLERVF